MSTGPGVAIPKAGGSFKTMAIGVGFFATVLGTFYYTRFGAHSKDDQTWITRHGQQPGNTHMPGMTGARLCTTNRVAEPANALAAIPLPGNDDNRGSDTFVGRLMSVVVGRGMAPDGKVPEHPTNKPVPVQQRSNAAGTHFYTKNLPFDLEAWKKRREETNEARIKPVQA